MDLDQLKSAAYKYRDKYHRAEQLFFEANDSFRLLYKNSKKDDAWDEMLEEMLEEGLEVGMEAECKRIIELRNAAGYGR